MARHAKKSDRSAAIRTYLTAGITAGAAGAALASLLSPDEDEEDDADDEDLPDPESDDFFA
jgi:hypothetical protein